MSADVLRGSYFLPRGTENSGDDVGHAIPLFGFGLQTALAGSREAIVFGFASVFRLAPITLDPALVFEAIKRWIKGALPDFETLFGGLLDAEENAVAVQRPERDGFENKHVERALQKIKRLVQRFGSPRKARKECRWRLLVCQAEVLMIS